MLLGIIVIVLRETLEASILISLLLSIACQYQLKAHWLLLAMILGVLGAVLYALNLADISDAFDYVGQEVCNAIIQYSIVILLILVFVLHNKKITKKPVGITVYMAAAVAFAIIREGGELVVFYSGVLQSGTSLLNAITSGFIGLVIGMSVGALCFYGLVMLASHTAKIIQNIMLALISSGMALQATQLLMQADWLPNLAALWDTNSWLAESSLLGQLAYAVLGYEATPSMVEVSVYFMIIVLFDGLNICLHSCKQIEC